MNIVEAITEKVIHLPTNAQEEVLEAVEQIEKRYAKNGNPNGQNGEVEHPLTTIAKMSKDVGVLDFAEKHDFYANRKLEE